MLPSCGHIWSVWFFLYISRTHLTFLLFYFLLSVNHHVITAALTTVFSWMDFFVAYCSVIWMNRSERDWDSVSSSSLSDKTKLITDKMRDKALCLCTVFPHSLNNQRLDWSFCDMASCASCLLLSRRSIRADPVGTWTCLTCGDTKSRWAWTPR